MQDLPWAWIILGLITVQRLAELVYANRNTKRLLAAGGKEIGAKHYPLIVAVHALWLAALWYSTAPDQTMSIPILLIVVLLQGARYWIISTLGPYWTTRIITVPDAPLITSGPYRFVRHPNYVVVILEIAVVPLMFGAWEIAFVFSILNAVALTVRIRSENATLSPRRDLSQ